MTGGESLEIAISYFLFPVGWIYADIDSTIR
jgi:hypothetical protein